MTTPDTLEAVITRATDKWLRDRTVAIGTEEASDLHVDDYLVRELQPHIDAAVDGALEKACDIVKGRCICDNRGTQDAIRALKPKEHADA